MAIRKLRDQYLLLDVEARHDIPGKDEIDLIVGGERRTRILRREELDLHVWSADRKVASRLID